MKLKRFLLRYFPPGIILEYESNGESKQKTIDLLDLTVDTDAEVLLNRILRQEPLIPESKRMYVRKLIYKLIEKQDSQESQQFYLFKILRAHILPLTNCAFNKSGDRFITGSYDRTCKVWNTNTGEELLTLEGHKNVVYAIAFNNPYGDKVITGSFDKTCKVWNANTGELYSTLRGHATEIVCLSFNPQGNIIATGSMDNTAKLWDVDTGAELCTLLGHTAEIVSLSFNQTGDKLITGSFDHTHYQVVGCQVRPLHSHFPGPPGGNFELSVRLGGREVHYWLHRQDMQDLGCQNWAITEYIARAQRRNSGRVV
eukprot:CAMPEP_0173079560 /NCGR_PEP_ID=MMETSP1102-20130122/15242_1 /TAXON_ID=49646 /ORGANISM="Geminigera sp., Strain Caron Lab Isolate" /LENGTH=312 /DNA_ID=CAMNT_0013951957 /DNA_START=207 /DNA_END=1145 /DNA_ORIENTATION=+